MGAGLSCVPAAPSRPYVGCTVDAAWQSGGFAETSIFDVYAVGPLLGSGTFGQVRLCWPIDDPESRRYAVKTIDTKSEVFRQAGHFVSAQQEASILMAVRHPNIIELVDVFEKGRWLFIVMECASGGEFFEAFADSRLSVAESCVAAASCQLLGGLRHLHDRQIIHRDVKAENILLASNPVETDSWHVKLVDFGLATRLEPPQCGFGLFSGLCQEMPLEEVICGTAYYCAPEVWANCYGPKVDVWAVGVVMYLAVLGNFPFYNKDVSTLEALITNPDEEPRFAAACAKECPNYQVSSQAHDCVAALLVKDQEARPDAAAALSLVQSWLLDTKCPLGSLAGRPRSCRSRSTSSEGSRLGYPQEGDQVIPLPIRAKAGRAAARPPVDQATDRSRTDALEAMKANAGGDNQGPARQSHGRPPSPPKFPPRLEGGPVDCPSTEARKAAKRGGA
mmetsp:Transcript_97387/g.197901  ORF Transcript_97387/g.197901 Transcript_97387/m.197901 type:complete len:449 (+) Transcript_97387:112-1458(+)